MTVLCYKEENQDITSEKRCGAGLKYKQIQDKM